MENLSDKQLEANRKNALKGGVKTDEGKQKTRFNAWRHGMLGNLVSENEKELYSKCQEALYEEHQPSTLIETILLERIALHFLKLMRGAKAEANFIQNANGRSGQAISQTDIHRLLQTYVRYEIATENRLYRAIRELKEYRQLQLPQ